MANLLHQAASNSQNLYGYFLAIQCLSQDELWSECADVARESIGKFQENTSISLQKMIYYQLVTALMEQNDHEALKVIRELTNPDNRNYVSLCFTKFARKCLTVLVECVEQ